MAHQGSAQQGSKHIASAHIDVMQTGHSASTRKWDLERFSDRIALAVGSTRSFYLHLLFYGGLFALALAGVSLSIILLLVATIVSLEGVFLVIFVQRSANQQAARLEEAIVVIRHNTADHLNEPLDVVVKDIRRELSETTARVAALSDLLSTSLAQTHLLSSTSAHHQTAESPAPSVTLLSDRSDALTAATEGAHRQPETIDILVVDDDRAIGDMICAVLVEGGYTARSVTSGQQALDLLAQNRPRLILADLDMPAMSGWALCAWLQAHEQLATIPIVLISGSAQIAHEASLLRVQGYIAKPFDIDHLLHVVQDHLSKK